MKRIVTLCTIALLASLPASGEFKFDDLEQAELRKLAQASHDQGSILVRIATLLQYGGEPTVPLATQVKAFWPQTQLKIAIDECGIAAEYFAGVPTRHMPTGLTRPQQVAGAFVRIDQCIIRLQNARPDLAILASANFSQAANVVDVDRIVASLQSMDRSLPYSVPWTNSEDPSLDAPLVGRHGDLELALKSHASVHIYFGATYGAWQAALREVDGAVGLGVTLNGVSGNVYDHYYEGLDAIGHLYELHAATWLATLGVVLDSEHAIILRDMAAGSGQRGYDFWRLQRQNENVGASAYNYIKMINHDANGVGRWPVIGMGQRLYLLQFAATHLGNTIKNDPLIAATRLPSTQPGQPGQPDLSMGAAELWRRVDEQQRRWAVMHNVFFQIDSAWIYDDKISGTYQMFHNGFPLPPPSGCVAPQVCMVPPEPPPACPECPPPPVCPSFIPRGTLAGDVLGVRCVQP